MDFEGKVVIITGASAGIGKTIAISFAKLGAKLTLVARNRQNLFKTAKNCIKVSKIEPQIIVADLSRENQARSVVPQTIKHWGKIDVLINNAGKGYKDSILHKDFVATLRESIDVNLYSAAILTNDAAPHLIDTHGNIINVSSISGLRQSLTTICYGVAKAALVQLTKSTALELAPKGVRVNSVNPGPVRGNFAANEFSLTEQENKEFYDCFDRSLPLRRCGTSEEVAELILFLASDKAKSITGSVHVIDSGCMLQSSELPKIE